MDAYALKVFRKKLHTTLDDNYYTDDQCVLNRHEYVPLFVYGTLKKGYPLAAHLEHSKFMGMAHTLKDNFVMYKTNNPLRINFPVILHNNNPEERGRISGEMYMVRPWTISQLDFIEQNGLSYHRDYVPIQMLDFRYPKKDIFWAYTYVGDADWWSAQMTKGGLDKIERFVRRKDPDYKYYFFQPPKRPLISQEVQVA